MAPSLASCVTSTRTFTARIRSWRIHRTWRRLAWAGLWHLMPPLIDRGVDPDAESRGVRAAPSSRQPPGERDIVERLLRRGADSNARCPLPEVWAGVPSERWPGEVPLEWAKHFAPCRGGRASSI